MVISAAVGFMRNGYEKLIKDNFYPLSGKSTRRKKRDQDDFPTVKIPVSSSTATTAKARRTLDAIYMRLDPEVARKTIVMFHGNGMTADDFQIDAERFFDEGYDVLCPTMGGYPGSTLGSKNVSTSEESTIRDAEAVRLFLQKQGVTQVGYYGLSIGATLALQAASLPSAATSLTTQFVICDQPFNSAKGVIANFLPAIISAFSSSVAQTAFPSNKEVRLSQSVTVRTDGLNNAKKIDALRERNIPFLLLTADRDDIMGSNLDQAKKSYQENLGDDLLLARYKTPKEQQDHVIRLKGEHGASFLKDPNARQRLFSFIKTPQ